MQARDGILLPATADKFNKNIHICLVLCFSVKKQRILLFINIKYGLPRLAVCSQDINFKNLASGFN